MGDYKQFTVQIKQKLGIDLSLYKEAQMKRRLTSLRERRGYENFADYFQALAKDKTLLQEFLDRMTINVSEFYRNPKRWEVLEKKIIPNLLHNRKKVKIWSAACSTGEEPYSVAMLMNEYFPDVEFEIIATDIDEAVISKAKLGIYTEQSLRDLPEIMKNKYFVNKNGVHHIDPAIKKLIQFKRHNLLADPYPKNIDLVLCRNVLIYFTDEAKDYIYHQFSESLGPNGILFVGSTEQIFNADHYRLSLIDTFFYQKNS